MLKEMMEKNQLGMKTKRGFWEWTDESIAKRKASIEKSLQAGLEILKEDAAG
jgi:3-hydroxybutyryl-CoA dehydrogenase